MHKRLLLLSSGVLVAALAFFGVNAIESSLTSRYSEFTIEKSEYPRVDDAILEGESRVEENYDPVELVRDVKVWERENEFLMLQNSIRFGYGPTLRDQVPISNSSVDKTILVIGDSFVWGQGAEDSEMRWSRRLEKNLNAQSGERYRVVTLARLASSTMDEAEWLSKERMALIDPDAVVVGFVRNDYAASYGEARYCRDLGTCAKDGGPPAISNPRNVVLVACLRGNESIFGRLISKVVLPVLPNIGRWMVGRWCDPDRLADIEGLTSEGVSIENPTESPTWDYFVESIQSMKSSVGSVPIFMADTRVLPWDNLDKEDALPIFRESGYNLIEMRRSRELLATVDNHNDLHINAADKHPGSELTQAYADDVSEALLSLFGKGQGVGVTSKNNRSLLSNYLPASVAIGERDGKVRVVSSPLNERQSKFYGSTFVRGKGGYAPQTTPCAAMGRAHVRLMLDSELKAGDNIELELTRSASSLVIQPIGYNEDGKILYFESYLLHSGEVRVDVLQQGQSGYLIGGVKAGCGEGVLAAPVFDLTIGN